MSHFRIKRGSTAPSFQVDLLKGDGKTPVTNLTGHTVEFHMRRRGTTDPVVVADAVVVAPSTATVRWDPEESETDQEPGCFDAEWWVTRPDASVFKVPAEGYDTVDIWDDIP